jgi:ATP-dependent HslUV protease subunit HslV
MTIPDSPEPVPTRPEATKMRATTILAVRREGRVALGGDGQVTLGATIMKSAARKIRRLYDGRVLVGFAGTSADAFALLDRFEGMIEKFQGNLPRAATELAKLWRTDKALRPLESTLVAADSAHLLLVSGTGDVIQPDEDALAVGSGGAYAAAAARALLRHTGLDARRIVEESLRIAGEICVYTNDRIQIEELP